MEVSIIIKVLICDDDSWIVAQVNEIIEEIQKKHSLSLSINCESSGSFMLQAGTDGYYDITVIDIEMPGVNGLELCEFLKKANADVQIIVLTAFNQYLDDAMQIHVFRYLSKPIEKERFINNFIAAVKEYKSINKLVVFNENNKTMTIRTKDILYIENIRSGSLIQTKLGEYTSSKKPQALYDEMNRPSCFAFSHHSILVNLQNVIDFSKTTVTLRKSDSETITTYVSQRKYNAFKKSFFDFAGGV